MLSFVPGSTPAHRLDPRSKLCFQAGFAVAALAADSVAWLAATYLLTAVVLTAARLSPVRVARDYRIVLGVLAVAPVVAGLALGPPWFRVGPARDSLFAVLRVPPVLAVSAAYVRTTPVRDTRAAIQRVVPGRPGQLLGVGVGLVFRFFPLVVDDLRTVRTAMHARAGQRRPFHDRARRLFLRGLDRTVARADRLAVALQARCFAWNPTLPALAFERADYPVMLAGIALGLAPVVPLFL
ncbi:biotin transport system permease protein [Halomicrobium zhouii]|uniref:Biotin transport system permease protein n=1 Tax=Halomicrobium zhouii TaxID=767519 RepID=A0A1I6KYU4_9EURY|nr:energy-coupling factor transporter transmembrane component T [Halomicrobium zhouii]SFR96357.1 biotin transport system permease protein [Halomicrobium zhouii]